MQGPGFNPGSVEMENNLQEQADRMVGLDEQSPLSGVRRQFLVDKYLQHMAEVIALCYRNFQRFGQDNIFLMLPEFQILKCSVKATLTKTLILPLVLMFSMPMVTSRKPK